MEPTPVRVASSEDRQPILDLLMLAFDQDPVMRWMFPQARDHVNHFPKFLMGQGGGGIDAGTAFVAGDYAGAALWLPPGMHSDEAALFAAFGPVIEAGRFPDAGAFGAGAAAMHPEDDHWYLAFLGVDPNMQGRGIGSAMLKHALAIVDAAPRIAYLETASEPNVRLYERFGFEVTGEVNVPGAPILWGMTRPAAVSG